MKKIVLPLCNGTETCVVVFSTSKTIISNCLHPLEDSTNGPHLPSDSMEFRTAFRGRRLEARGGGEAERGLAASQTLLVEQLLKLSSCSHGVLFYFGSAKLIHIYRQGYITKLYALSISKLFDIKSSLKAY